METYSMFFLVMRCLAVLVYVFNVLGNLLAVVVFKVKIKRCKSPNTYFLVTLASTDLVFSAILFADIMVFSAKSPFSYLEQFTHALVIIYIYVALAVERYFAILKPFVHMRKASKSLCFKVLFIIYALAVVLSFPANFLGPARRRFDAKWRNTTSHETLVVPEWLETAGLVYTTVLSLFGLVFPSILILYCYSRVVYHVWFNVDPNKATSTSIVKSRHKLTKLFILLTAVFIFTWIPTLVRLVTTPFGLRSHLKFEMVALFACLIGSTANPVIYFARCPNYRQDVKRLMTKCCRCNKRLKIQPSNAGTVLTRANTYPLAQSKATQ
ncbi:putative G-protein coupled receptor 19 [Acropora palmata]|uniref:putative G-protein coupled receptor 19 n=1 Tax=Acropora palmata TaxID=6131 RepID=UPI003DA057B7